MTYRHAFALVACLFPALPAAAATDAPLAPMGAPTSAMLVVNDGKPGVLRGTVPIRLDARKLGEEFAFVVLWIGDRRAFLSNAPQSVQGWDTRAYPDGKYTLVAEAHAKAWLLARSPGVEVEIRNHGSAADRGFPQGARLAAGCPKAPAPPWKSVTVVSPPRAVVVERALRLHRDHSHVSVRRVIEAAGGRVRWTPASRRVDASYGWHRASMAVGRSTARRDGLPVRLDGAPYLRAGRTQVTARSLARLLDLLVGWVHEAKSVRLVEPGVPAAALAAPK